MTTIQGRRSPVLPKFVGGVGTGDADVGLADGLGLAPAATTLTTTSMPDFGFPLVMTGTPAAFRQIAPPSPTSAVTT